MQPSVVFLGAGAFAREAYDWATQAGRPIAGFYAPQEGADELRGKPVFHTPSEVPADAGWIAALGTPSLLRRFVAEVGIQAAPAIVHPSCVIGTDVRIGAGSILCPLNVLSCDIRIGNGVVLNAAGTTGHDAVIGDYCGLLGKVSIAGGTVLGTAVMMGTGSVTVPGVRIADNTVVGAGAVVTKDLEPGVYAGVPARLLKPL